MWKASAGNQAVSRISSQDKAQGAKNCGDRWPGWAGQSRRPAAAPAGAAPSACVAGERAASMALPVCQKPVLNSRECLSRSWERDGFPRESRADEIQIRGSF